MFRKKCMKNPWKNQKSLEFFWFFCLSSTKASFKKQKKTKVFLVFKNLNQKNSRKTKKKQSFDLKPKLLQKVLVFWFSRRFVTYWSNSASFSKILLFQIFLFDSGKDYVTKPRENQKTKTFWRSFGFRSKDVFFWFSLSFIVFFWFRFLKTKKNRRFFLVFWRKPKLK